MKRSQEMDNAHLESRKRQLDNLKHFIFSSLDKSNSIINFMGWDAPKVLEDNGLIQCSIQPSHRMPRSSVTKHVSKCIFRQEGYTSEDEFLSEPGNSEKSSIYITDDTKTKLFAQAQKNSPSFKRGWISQGSEPRTSDRLTSTFTKDERLILYDYAISNTESHAPLPEFDVIRFPPKTEKPLTYEEKLVLERNAKRRRIKYKAVHTNKKSYREVMKEVIDGQMKLYEEWCGGNTESADSEKKKRDDSQSSCSKRLDSDYEQHKRHTKKVHHKTRDDSDYHRRHYSHRRS